MLCGAQKRQGGGRCRWHAVPGKRRCKFHGGRNKYQPHRVVMGPAWAARNAKAAQFRAAGLPWPNGDRTRPKIRARFMAAIEEARAELVPVIAEGGAAGKLAEVNDLALDALKRFFDHSETYDLDDLKAARLINDAALGVITRQLKVDDGRWRRANMDTIGQLLAEIADAKRLEKPKE